MIYEVEYYSMPVDSNEWRKLASIRVPDANTDHANEFISRLIKAGADVYETDEATVYHIYPIPRHMTKFIFYK